MMNVLFVMDALSTKKAVRSVLIAALVSVAVNLGASMKGIILAGGRATRLFPLTHVVSKQLLPIYNRPMIFYPLNTLVSSGITEILIIVNPRDAGQFITLLGPMFEKTGINISFKVQTQPRGLADAFIIGENFIGEDNVTMVLGDNIFEYPPHDCINSFESGALTFTKEVTHPEKYGVINFYVSPYKVVEKPKTFVSNYAITGLYVFDSSVRSLSHTMQPSQRGELEIVDLIQMYNEQGQLKVEMIEGSWFDAGTFEDYMKVNQFAYEHKLHQRFHPLIEQAIKNYT